MKQLVEAQQEACENIELTELKAAGWIIVQVPVSEFCGVALYAGG